jgi:hypothetical protein
VGALGEAYRVVQEPRRLWRRYFIECPAFLLKVVGQLWSGTRISNFGIIKDDLQNSSVAEALKIVTLRMEP